MLHPKRTPPVSGHSVVPRLLAAALARDEKPACGGSTRGVTWRGGCADPTGERTPRSGRRERGALRVPSLADTVDVTALRVNAAGDVLLQATS